MIAQLTMAGLVRPCEKSAAWLYDLALVLGGSVLIAMCTQIAVGHPVPWTGQTFAVLMVGALLGSRRGALSVLMYLLEGSAGFPVFSHGRAGLAVFFGPTGGYLIGFVLAAYLVGRLAERGWDRRLATTVLAMALGNAVLYGCGLAWLTCLVHLFGRSLGSVLAIGLYPFLPGEVVKIALATALLPAGWRLIRYFGFDKMPKM
ncbi:MAG: biotin transporter BioY [Sedimentisphaerales bacterium]|nr:biotin transporter BioY [Sedimentisphaerales bacterium]NLZ03629.1 biotin transporter BioY [Phycisphaerae bacterium]HNY78535.1 biotin transporter BioY [Sedimentisphaerales bacterium]HOC63807.1 biotin transporter BioY [Sedimentisphaerales bacterium]HOH64517.1 biotin transporter BioY [Sedimentisphaerales bacterium]